KAVCRLTSHAIDARERSCGQGIEVEIRENIADRSKPGACVRRGFRLIDDLIYFARQKTTFQMNEMRVGHKLAFHGMGNAPLPARDYPPRAIGRVANGEDVFCAGRIVDGVTLSSSGAQQDMSQRHVVSCLG